MTEETGHRRDPPSTAPRGVLDAIERISRTASIAAIPVVLAIGGWIIQRQLQNQTVSRDYVQLALTILQSPDQSKVPPELREWAVDLLNENSPTKLNAKAIRTLKSGEITLPSFRFVPSAALTPKLQAQLEKSLREFQEYLNNLGFPRTSEAVPVEIREGATIKIEDAELNACWDPENDSIVVARAYAEDQNTVLRQLAHRLLENPDAP